MAGSVVVKNLSKRFGHVRALDGVSARFEPGEVHAVVGENGAGKSTLMHIVGGFMSPESGSVELDGEPLPLGDPRGCKKRGVELVHQHFTLAQNLTVGENLALAAIPRFSCVLDERSLLRSAKSHAQELGWTLDFSESTRSLSVGAQQRVEILKSLASEAQVLILDEPTAVLAEDEVAELFRLIDRLRTLGRTVVLIAHKIPEVMAIADRVTVLRGGRLVASARTSTTTSKQLADWMVGELPAMAIQSERTDAGSALVANQVRVLGDRGNVAVDGATFEIARGEILGFGGVDGNGQLELAEALANVRRLESGSIQWFSEPISDSSPRIGYIPQDRQQDGLALDLSIEDNLLIEGHRRDDIAPRGFIAPRVARHWATNLARRYELKSDGLSLPASSLSGGNQQKVIVSRVLDADPELLVAANPGRGLDVRATRFVHEQIRAASRAGVAVALFSTDLDELATLADRVTFMSGGRLETTRSAEAMFGSRS